MREPVALYIDHTLLKANCSSADITRICGEAVDYGFAAVCVPPFVVKQAAKLLKKSKVKAATVIGFPMGYASTASKLLEIREAILDGADELDVVINLIALKNGDWQFLEKEIHELVGFIHDQKKIIKLIVESGMLSRDEIIKCCNIFGLMGIDFMKTSTGYADKGASVADVELMRSKLPRQVKIKASGGIRHYAFAEELIEAGADRLGCSASLQIVEEEKATVIKKN